MHRAHISHSRAQAYTGARQGAKWRAGWRLRFYRRPTDALTADCVCVTLNQQSVWVVMDVAVAAIGELAAGVVAG